MKKGMVFFILVMCSACFLATVTSAEETEKSAAAQTPAVDTTGEPVYLKVSSAEASSFDQTPDWAPEPNAMAASDGDILTRWSSDYNGASQWIYFDLGKECAVSDVIVRWERAFAIDYKILVSNDAKAWQEVYHKTAAEGGAIESIFPSVKCRYVQILSVEKANEDWGISIWEVEIYGPRGENPESTLTKEAYLAKDKDTVQKEEAEKLIESLAAPVVPISEKPFQKGVVYTSWMADELLSPASDITLAYLKKTGFDTVAIMVPAYQEDLDSTEIFTNDKEGGDTPTIESLEHAIQICHKLGLRVLLKPHVDPRTNEARINIMPSEDWFTTYEKFIVRYAELAQKNNVEIFGIGTELEATTFDAWNHRWNQVIDKVREVYKGLLTYCANWTEYEEVPFWNKLDFVGIDAYFPLTEKSDATMDELKEAWEREAGKIETWLTEKGLAEKGVLFTEIGYPSSDGANRQPWVAITKLEDQDEQADCLRACFEVMMKRPWFKGYYIWQYFPQERWSPLGFTVKGKKSEEVIKEWLNKN